MISENAGGSMEPYRRRWMQQPLMLINKVLVVLRQLEKLIQKSTVSKEESAKILKRVNEVTKNILDSGDDIAKRREAIQADRERVVANQRRTADMIVKANFPANVHRILPVYLQIGFKPHTNKTTSKYFELLARCQTYCHLPDRHG